MSLLATYNEERLPVISEMLELTTSLFNDVLKTGATTGVRTPKHLYMLGIHCRFSSIVLGEFRVPIDRKPINTYGLLDEGHVEAGDRAPDAPKLLHIQPEGSDMTTLFSVYRPWYHTILVFTDPNLDCAGIM
jgi:hypothetical protein